MAGLFNRQGAHPVRVRSFILCRFDALIQLLVIQNVHRTVAVAVGQQAEVVLVRQLFRGAAGGQIFIQRLHIQRIRLAVAVQIAHGAAVGVNEERAEAAGDDAHTGCGVLAQQGFLLRAVLVEIVADQRADTLGRQRHTLLRRQVEVAVRQVDLGAVLVQLSLAGDVEQQEQALAVLRLGIPVAQQLQIGAHQRGNADRLCGSGVHGVGVHGGGDVAVAPLRILPLRKRYSESSKAILNKSHK